MVLSKDEIRDLAPVQEAYAALVRQADTRDWQDGASDALLAAKVYLQNHPDSDGAILAEMMASQAQGILADEDNPSSLLALDFLQATRHLFKRHPERIPYIVNDLIDLGMEIIQVKHIEASARDPEVLLFAFQFRNSRGWPTDQIFTLVNPLGSEWTIVPLAIVPDAHGDYSETKLGPIGDINADGQTEVTVEQNTQFADRSESQFSVWVLRRGAWIDLLSTAWGNGEGDPSRKGWWIDGDLWLEDLDHDGVQEIVVYSSYGAWAAFLTEATVYQWDPQKQLYTNEAPVRPQVCGYHAFAEATRRRALADLAGAVPWYEEARRRWLNESRLPNSICLKHRLPDEGEINRSFIAQMQVQAELSGTNSILDGFYSFYPVLRDSVSTVMRTDSNTITTKVEWANVYLCDTPACRVVVRDSLNASYSEDWASGHRVQCYSTGSDNTEAWAPEYWHVDPPNTYIAVSDWHCEITDKDNQQLFKRDQMKLINACTWDGRRYRLDNSRIIGPYIYPGSYLDEIDKAYDALPGLVDCSGDPD